MFVSYAQNFEDVILWRALKHIPNGFYIDVGAQDPVVDSVSLAFYERGWRGVHVEPSARYAYDLRRSRPDEEVLQVAIGEHANEITFFEICGTGLSTGLEAISRAREAEGFTVQRRVVPCLPLSAVLDGYRDRDIHWLKIDIEGMEEEAIGSWAPSTVRPWIVVVESTRPRSPEASHCPWEPWLLELGYDFVYFDGLNRFYVSALHRFLGDALALSPNVFDDFTLSGTSTAQFSYKLQADAADIVASIKSSAEALLKTERERWHRQCDEAANLLKSKEETADLLEAKLAAIHASVSWRITSPLRTAERAIEITEMWLRNTRRAASKWTSRHIRALPTLAPVSRARSTARNGIRTAAQLILVRPKLAQCAKRVLRRFPAVELRFRTMAQASTSRSIRTETPEGLADLGPRARHIYAALQSAIVRQRAGA